MTRTIGDLPMEIMDLIVDFISFKDVMTCLYVNHEWYTLFERILYKTVDTRNRGMFLFFLKRLTTTLDQQQQQHHSFPLGHFVRELKINDGFMTEKQMTELKRACPNITSLTFRWQDSKAHEAHVYSSIDISNEKSHTKKNRRYFGVPKKIMDMFPCVTQFTLECEAKWRRTRPLLLDDFIQHYLFATHNLQSLTLNNVLRKLCYRSLDLIHEACPNLMRLAIVVSSTSDYDGYLEKPTRLQNLDGPEWPREKLVRIQYITLSDHSTQSTITLEKCIRYFAARYPDLRSISFTNRGRELSWDSSTDFDSSVPWQYVPPFSSTSSTTIASSSSSSIQETYTHNNNNNNNDRLQQQQQQQDDDNTMGLLAKRCPKLHSIELLNVALPSNAMKHLFSGQQLEHVSLKLRYNRTMNHQGFYEMLRLLYPKAIQLSLSLPSSLISLIDHLSRTTTNETLILSNFNTHDVIGFKNLVQLQLIQRSSGPIQMTLNHILEICPVLQVLTLVHTDVTANKVTEDDLKYPFLKTIKLRNVHIASHLFMKFISDHCPQLLHFHMLRCTGPTFQQRLSYTDGSQFMIDFPHHQLKSLVIFQHVVIQPSRINLVALDFSNKNKNLDISHNYSLSSSSSSSTTPTPTKTRVPSLYYYDHWYLISENVTPTSFIRKTSKYFYKNYKEINFDDTDMIYPPFIITSSHNKSKQHQEMMTSIKKLTMDQGNELMNYIQSESPTLSRKRKRNYVECMKQQQEEERTQFYSTSSDRIMNECRKEIDLAGYFPIRCQSISKLVFNGTFIIHNGTCLPSTSFISNE